MRASPRRPSSWAGMTRVSLKTRTSPARSSPGRSDTARSASPSGRTSSSRALSRGLAGRSAIRSGGSSKSKRSTRTDQGCGLGDAPAGGVRGAPGARGADAGGDPVSDWTSSTGSGGAAPGDRAGGRLAAAISAAVGRRRIVAADRGAHDPGRRGRRDAALDLVDMLHAGHDAAEHRIFAVHRHARHEHDVELAVGAVRLLGPRHRDGAAQVRQIVELGGQVRQVGRAVAGAQRIAALGHEAFDDAVEGEAVVEAAAGQRLDPLDMAGRVVRAQLDHHAAAVRQVQDPAILRRDGRGDGAQHRRGAALHPDRGHAGLRRLRRAPAAAAAAALSQSALRGEHGQQARNQHLTTHARTTPPKSFSGNAKLTTT
jgi:hypothetical protein